MAKKKPHRKKKEEPQTQCGVTVGEVVWCTLATSATGHGRIVTIHPLNKEGPAITIYDEISGAYRVGLVESITEGHPTKSQVSKLTKAKVKRLREMEKK